MPRTREFKPDSVIDAALDLFWRKGYKACSMADVVKQSGVARYGLYQAFKDKDQLYCAALKRYRQKVSDLMLKPFRRQDKSADYNTLIEHFDLMLSELENGQHDGCFAHQAAIERAAKDPNVDRIVRDFFNEAKDSYRVIIQNAVQAGQIRDLPVEDLVVYVMGIQRALIAMSKQNCPFDEREKYVHCSLELLKTNPTQR